MHNWNPMFILSHLLILAGIGFMLSRLFGWTGLGRVFTAPFRLVRLLALLVLVGLAGCANHEKLPVATGPIFALNPDHWQAMPNDLALPDGDK